MLYVKFSIFAVTLIMTVVQLYKDTKISRVLVSSLAFIVMVLSGVDAFYSYVNEKKVEDKINNFSSRILWNKTEAKIYLIMSNDEDFKKDSHQVGLKIFPGNLKDIEGISREEIINVTEKSRYGYLYFKEDKAQKLWNILKEKGGGFKKEVERKHGVESIFFNDHAVNYDQMGQAVVKLGINSEPEIGFLYRSLNQLKGKFLVARIHSQSPPGSYIAMSRLEVSTKKGLLNLHFFPELINEKERLESKVRYVGIYLKKW